MTEKITSVEYELLRYTSELLSLTFERKRGQRRRGVVVLLTISEFLHASGDAGKKIAVACCFWIHWLTADADFVCCSLAHRTEKIVSSAAA